MKSMGGEPLLPEESPCVDEGWWNAILAEEESRAAPPPQPHPQQEEKSKPSVDWDRAGQVYNQDQIISLAVTGFNRGGLLVEGEGLAGFVPCSHLVDLPIQAEAARREDCLSSYVGRTLHLKVIEFAPNESRLVFSERAARAEAGKRTALFGSLQAGQRVAGDVTNVTDFGVFVDLGGVEGLIHISELSWGRVAHPGQVLNVGQRVEVLVMDVSAERCRVALSLKRLCPNPWETAEGRYPVDSLVPAVVTALVPFGAFARLEEGLEGLIHLSEIPLPPGANAGDILSPGLTVTVRVLQVEAARQRLGLSLRAAS
ncbi:MAG: rpsA [Anaerolineaceae bacterium]|nr:MAG: rpsA [Anaerolineaceae bacterium]